ncbi:M48 family metallopeptidase, partial [Dyella silvatica]|uniref:M48 family metallopeptidase n=1 Tax=Dyella silvatica TaxID=2992128 RepID=UPI00225490A2
MMSLSDGGRSVAESLGAIPVPANTGDPKLRQLRNVIEEMAIAAGMPVPGIYLMEDEPGINAFAAGYSVADAVICVTQGCLDYLTRDELQGVIAHEFSHVLNGDMRLNIRLMGLLFGIMMLAVIGRQLSYLGDTDSERRRGIDLYTLGIGLTLLSIGYLGYFFGRLIQAAVARSRETLADASAVQFTRQTHGIAGALKKIAVVSEGSELQVGNRHEVAHMLFGEADESGFFQAWYATHPPLLKRIRSLDPVFRERELEKLATSMQAVSEQLEKAREPAPVTSSAAAGAASDALWRAGLAASMPRDHTQLGRFDQAADLQRNVPAALKQAAAQPESAMSLVFALAMSTYGALRDAQQRLLANAFGDDLLYTVSELAAEVGKLSPELRLPLISLAFPALRQLPEGRLQTFLDTLDALVRASRKVNLDDYCLTRLLRVQLLEAMRPRSAPVDGKKKLPACVASVSLVLAVVAAYGHADQVAANRAWLLAMDNAFPGMACTWQAPPADWQGPFERALIDLDGLMPAAKDILIQSLDRAIRADGSVTMVEAELLRVICASLHCPLPPLQLS